MFRWLGLGQSPSSNTPPSSTTELPTELALMNLPPYGTLPLPGSWCPRPDLVSGLWRLARAERLVQVRGSPASGKTTLRRLLEHHIACNDPDYRIHVIQGWSPSVISDRYGGFAYYIKAVTGHNYHDFFAEDKKVVILLDEGQDSYWDQIFWTEFLKSIDGTVGPIVVMFCSYGSTGSQPVTTTPYYDSRTPLNLSQSQCIGLAPQEHGLGLLLNMEEGIEVVLRKLKAYPDIVVLEPKLLQFLISFSDGHVGCLMTLTEILYKAFQQRLRRNASITYDDFVLEYQDQRKLARAAADHRFSRGLLVNSMREPDLNVILKALVTSRHLSSSMLPTIAVTNGWTIEAVQEKLYQLHRRGFLYSHHVVDSNNLFMSEQVYVLPSGFHAWFYSVYLAPANPPGVRLESPKEIVFTAIKNFSPTQLRSSAYRVGPAGICSPKEATFHFELYRTLHDLLGGSLHPMPEYGKDTNDSIDLMIPHYKWGIEVMYDGRKMKKHIERFRSGGAYAAWTESGEMSEYIIINFRMNRPAKSLSGGDFVNFYHICFDSDFSKASIFEASNVECPVEEFHLI